MSRPTDVIVAGSGLAGLMAAYAAAKKGAKVKIVSEGMGNLAISPGCIDLLGYDQEGGRLDNPWDGIAKLPPEHPYSLVGKGVIESSLQELTEALASRGLQLVSAKDADGTPKNSLAPTIMGTFKPTWLVPAAAGDDEIRKAQKILVISVKGFRDCRPRMIVSQLRRYSGWENREFDTLVLPRPFDEHGRAISALDLAHFTDRGDGRDWFLNRIRGVGKKYDLALLPPILGAKPDSRIRAAFADALGCKYVEMLCVPPGVAGLRIRKALVDILVDMGAQFYENARIVSATTNNGKCESITTHSSGRDLIMEARTFVIATGGIIGGGVILGQGKASEAVFGLEIEVPADVDDWSSPEIFGSHLVSRLGVKTGRDLRVAGLENVYFAGRTLAGYDYAAEKSGHGVACSTGWQAGNLAAAAAQGGNQ